MENLFYDQEAYSTYMDDLNNSQGFYVTPSIDGPVHIGAIRPVEEYSGDLYRKAELAAKFAVEEQNKKEQKEVEMKLKFLNILNLNVQPCAGKMYFITMEAQYPFTGERNHYQVKVWEKLSGGYQVKIFRKAPYWVYPDKFVNGVYCIGIENLKPWMDESYLYYKCFYRGCPQILGVELMYNEGEGDSKGVLWFKTKAEAGKFLMKYSGKRMPCTDDQFYEFCTL